MKLSHFFRYAAFVQYFSAAENYETLLRGNTGFERNTVRTLQVGTVGKVTKLVLVNANLGNQGQALIDPILNGTIVNLANYPTNQKLSVQAVTSTADGPVGSVQFMFDGTVNFQTENTAPYAMCRDNLGVFTPCPELVAGKHTVAATPYSLTKATGIKGQQTTVSFSIVTNIIPTKAPSMAPKSTPVVVPKSSPVSIPKSAPVTAPVAAPATAPKSTPVSVPLSAPVTVPKSTPVAAPINIKNAKWIEVNPNAPINARHEACFVMVGRKAYLLAGRGVQAVNIYDPVTRTWTNGTAPPIQIHHTQCVAVGNSIWIVSSWTGGYPMEKNTDKIYIYNTLTNTWSTKAGLPIDRRRGGAAAVLVGDKIYVSHGNIGGHETGNFSTTLGWLDYYDISEDKWYTNLTDAPNPRDHAGGGLVNGRICVAGGRDGGDIDFFKKVILPTDCYDPATSRWSQEANIPYGRGGSSYGTTCDGKLMVAGGEGGSKTATKSAWANVDVFDGTSWTSTSSLNVARHGSGLAVDCKCNQIHIASGAGTQGGRNQITSVETLFPDGIDAYCPV